MDLHINGTVLRKAFFYANAQGLNLSDMVEEYLNRFVTDSTQKEKLKGLPVSEGVRSLVGRLSIEGKDIDWEKEKMAYFEEKYGR